MINMIRTKDGKVWTRRSKGLVTGEICCPRCGDWKKVGKFTDKHFTEEYTCSTCKGELKTKDGEPTKVSGHKPKKVRAQFPENCPHRPFFGCRTAGGCIGCYYNPDVKIALMKRDEDDQDKTAKDNWFYGNKKHAKECLAILEDIKHGRGLLKGGNRTYFKYARNKGEEE